MSHENQGFNFLKHRKSDAVIALDRRVFFGCFHHRRPSAEKLKKNVCIIASSVFCVYVKRVWDTL